MATNKPTHRAYIVEDSRTEGGKGHFFQIGTVWAHKKSGNGFDVVIPAGLSITGPARIVCLENKPQDAAE